MELGRARLKSGCDRCNAGNRYLSWERPHRIAGCVLSIMVVAGAAARGQQVAPEFPGAVQAGVTELDEVPTGDGEDFRGLHLPSDRTASRGLAMAEERIKDGQYSQAIRFLDGLLAGNEDAFTTTIPGADHYTGLKAEARRLLSTLPKSARDDYVLTYGTTAAKRLEAAVSAGDHAEIERVARQFFHTPAGYEATLMLALQERDMGRPLGAAVLLQELIESEHASTLFGPQLYLYAAIAWRDAGQTEQARTTLELLKQRFTDPQLLVAGTPRSLFQPGQDPLAWLEALVGPADSSTKVEREQWVTYRGNAARNAVADGGIPHMSVRWRAWVTSPPELEQTLSTLRRGYERRGIVALPATQPIAVGDVALMRTAQGLVGVDIVTGRLIWDVRPEPDDDFQQLVDSTHNGDAVESMPQLAHALEQRMWDDALYGTLSSDGERAYAVRGLSLSISDDEQALQFGRIAAARIRNRGVRSMEQTESTFTNTLTALELRSEGKRVWEINGGSVDGKLAGAFFLGPPLCLDDRLYALAEIRSTIYLVVLRNTDVYPHWELDWIQQLASVEVGIQLDPFRRLAAAMPSFQGGVLVCPTSAGVVVGVDITKRSLLWAYRYGQREQDLPQALAFGASESVEAPGMRVNDRWVDSTAILSDGRVLLTPRESDELHCLDLATGKLVWNRKRGAGLFIAGVHNGVVGIVGADRFEGVLIEDGRPAWTPPLTPLPDNAQPSGRGILTDSEYYLPLNTAEVIAINMTTGEIVSRVRSRDGQVLGNIIAHKGAIISQNEVFLEKYDQRDAFRRETEAALAADPLDPFALRNLGELALGDGDIDRAILLLKQSLQQDATSTDTQDMLVEALLEGLAHDFSKYRDELPLTRQLATRPAHQTRLARLTALGLQATGNLRAAFESYLRLAELDATSPQLQSMSAHWEARTSRWIRAQLSELWDAASDEEQEYLQDQLQRQALVPDESAHLEQLEAFLEYFSGFEAAIPVKRRAAEAFAALRPGIGAEMLLSQVESHSHERDAGWAVAWRAHIMHALGRHNQAGVYDRRLLTTFADVEVRDGRSGSELVEQFHRDGVVRQPVRWQRGKVHTTRESISGNEQHDRYESLRVDGPVDAALEGFRFFIDRVQQALVVVDPFGNLQSTTPLLASPDQPVGFDLRSRRCHAVAAGHLLIMSFGERIVAVDLLQDNSIAASPILWEATTVDPYEGLAAQLAYPQLARQSRSYRTFGSSEAGRGYAIDDDGRPLGWIGPVDYNGVVFQAQGELRCVDPLTGSVLWSRRDVPPGSALFGDDEFVFALRHQSTEASVYRKLDGKQLGIRNVPRLEEHFEVLGRKILTWTTRRVTAGNQRRVLNLVDAWTGQTIWTRELPVDAKICAVDADWVSTMDQTGKFEILRSLTGEVVLSKQLLPEPILGQIFVMRSSEQVVLVTDRPVNRVSGGSQVNSIYDPDFPIVTGRVYVFDRATGRAIWPVPAEIDRQGLALRQPVELPLLGFVSHSQPRSGTRRGNNISLLLLNKSNGAAIERAEIVDATTMQFRIYPEPNQPNVVLVDMANHRVRLEFSDQPAAPEPPADSDVEGTREKSRGRGVFGIFSSATRRGNDVGQLAAARGPR